MTSLENIFGVLKEKGVEHIRRLAPNTWTDHNPSDPGITLLEQLCVAITDLEYRIDFDFPDHLAPGGEDAYSVFFSPRTILTGYPVTPDDYRNVFIDVPGVKNADMVQDHNPEPKLLYAPFSNELLLYKDRDNLLPEDIYQRLKINGLWKVSVQPERNTNGAWVVPDVDRLVYKKAQETRSLCTDYSEVTLLEPQPVKIELGVELEQDADPQALIPEIYAAVELYISPYLTFHSVGNLLQENMEVEAIFDGPALHHGFLKRADVQTFQRRCEIRRSDLIHRISKLKEGIKTVRYLNIAVDNKDFMSSVWITALDKDRAAIFDQENSDIRFYRGNMELEADKTRANQTYAKRKQERIETTVPLNSLDLFPAPVSNRDTGHYISIREYIPELYGVSPTGLPPEAKSIQQASVKQLSAYLMFFEQILANCLSQLENAWKLFSINRTDTQSYYAQSLENLPALEQIYSSLNTQSRLRNILAATENETIQKERTERFTDHLLARFAESLSDYSLLLSSLKNEGVVKEETSIPDKRAFMKEYPALSSKRGTARNYLNEFSETDNISGLKQRLTKMMGLAPKTVNNAGARERFYILEHILLRPVNGDNFQEHPLLGRLNQSDPYSFQLSFVFPGNTGRFNVQRKKTNNNTWHKLDKFSTYVVGLLCDETPAHLNTFIYWMDEAELVLFEEAYHEFMYQLSLSSAPIGDDHQYRLRVARDYLLDILFKNQLHFQIQVGQSNITDLLPYTNSEDSISGVPYPLRDLPVSSPVYAEPVDDPPTQWSATIRIYYSQKNVIYFLTDRYRSLLEPVISKSGDKPDGTDEQNRPYIEIPISGNLAEEPTYFIRASKKGLKDVFLKQPVKVIIGIMPVDVEILTPEINYGEQVTVQLKDTQAGVDYILYEGGQDLLNETIVGKPGATLVVNTSRPKGFAEDTIIYIRGSRDGFISWQLVGTTQVRVRANPHLTISVQPVENLFDKTEGQVLITNRNESQTQKSVTYTLFYMDVADWLYVHQKAGTQNPPAKELLEISHSFGTALIHPYLINNYSSIQPLLTRVASKNIAKDGDEVGFDITGLNLKEDTLFIVEASKTGHDTPAILHHPGLKQLHTAAVLVYPNTSLSVTVEPQPIKANTRGRIIIANPQPGVKYFLRSNSVNHKPVFCHDITTTSLRRDGVGYSKIGSDWVSGPAREAPIELFTGVPLSATLKNVEIVAEKIQTGIQAIVAVVTIDVQ